MTILASPLVKFETVSCSAKFPLWPGLTCTIVAVLEPVWPSWKHCALPVVGFVDSNPGLATRFELLAGGGGGGPSTSGLAAPPMTWCTVSTEIWPLCTCGARKSSSEPKSDGVTP